MTLTRPLREELAHAPARGRSGRRAEAAAITRVAGRLRLRGGAGGTTVEVEVRCAQASVARRLRAVLVGDLGVRPGLAQQRRGNLAGSAAYLVTVDAASLGRLGLLDDNGRPRRLVAADVEPRPAFLAGALMATGSLSGPGTALHLAIRTGSPATAETLGAAIPGAATIDERVVLRGGDHIEALLADVGATATLSQVRRSRRDREHRRQANRAVNAEAANLARATAAAHAQIAAIEHVVQALGWESLDEDLRAVALARVANPALPLAELGSLLDPPVTKATVHRRLGQLQRLASDL